MSELRRARAVGVRGVVFTGGEATLHPDLPAAIRAARKLGFASIQLQTNGRGLAYRELCRELLRCGITEFSPSIHGSRPAIHDALTQTPGSWSQVVAGIRNLKALGAYVLTNTVITTKNFRDLPALARLLVRLGADQFQFAFVHIVGTARANRDWLVPRASEVMPYVRKGLDIGQAHGLLARTEAIPYCLMRGYEHCIAEGGIPDTRVVDSVRVDDFGRWRRFEGKAKGPDCGRCRWDRVCEGPWKEYPELRGWGEFKIVPAG